MARGREQPPRHMEQFIQRRDALVQEIQQAAREEREERLVEGDEAEQLDLNEESGKIWDRYVTDPNYAAEFYCGVPRTILSSVLQDMQPHIALHKKPGKQPKFIMADHLVLWTIHAHSNFQYETLAAWIKEPASTITDAINRVRPILKSTMNDKWSPEKFRPIYDANSQHPDIGLLMDSTSIKINKPTGTHSEAKVCFDGKNKIYALKKECAVLAKPPNYCLFTSPQYPGSKHDFAIHKENFHQYLPFLLKTPAELARNNATTSWSILGDKAYIGPPRETPNLSRVAIPKDTQPGTARAALARELALVRVPVEQYFGRLTKMWGILSTTYQGRDHDVFSDDFDICVGFTNYAIELTALVNDDEKFYHALQKKYIKEYEAESAARKQAQKEWNDNRKRKRSLDPSSSSSSFSNSGSFTYLDT